uniref:G_PROTEIN_RECEP_F1_2 domain-containing protein n=1 Tax=Macrostomum lignano TaxID=282301 RepID=A0A1I8FWQ2_9PLAT
MLSDFPCKAMANSSAAEVLANATNPTIRVQDAALGCLLSVFVCVTVFGNSLVIVAVLREHYLRSITNYFIVSLATADLLMGAVVMPFAVASHVTNDRWPFGATWCDLWHAFDVLSSTASILNLCMIAIERYWAIENPMSYPSKVTKRRCLVMIGVVWVCASLISFPAIAWWHAAEPSMKVAASHPTSARCKFTSDPAYLICSSIVSFYAPLLVMLFVYWKIYRTAVHLVRGWQSGAKVLRGRGLQTSVVLRIIAAEPVAARPVRVPSARREDDQSCFCDGGGVAMDEITAGSDDDDEHNAGGGARGFARRLRSSFGVRKKLLRFSREQRAAKTLGIVMGVFIACWMPFFVCNVISALSDGGLGASEAQIFAVVTWLGYVNSSVNPAIYAHSMRDFRRAFISLLSCRRRRGGRGGACGSNSGGQMNGGRRRQPPHSPMQAPPSPANFGRYGEFGYGPSRSPALSLASPPQTPLRRLWPATPERVQETQALLMRELRTGASPQRQRQSTATVETEAAVAVSSATIPAEVRA